MVICLYYLILEYSNRSSISSSNIPQGFSVQPRKIVYVINFEIRDTHEDATVGARAILQMALLFQPVFDNKDSTGSDTIDSVILSCQEKFPDFNIVYGIFFY